MRSSSCQDGDPGFKREEGERGDSASTTGSRMSAAPRRPRAGESNNDLVIAESSKEQQQVVNGGGGDLRERSGSRRGRRRVTSLRGGEKGQGRSRQNQGQVGWMFYQWSQMFSCFDIRIIDHRYSEMLMLWRFHLRDLFFDRKNGFE